MSKKSINSAITAAMWYYNVDEHHAREAIDEFYRIGNFARIKKILNQYNKKK